MDGPAAPVRLLLVDDSEEFLRAETAWLAALPGFEIAGVARSGEEALEAVRRLRPDIVLMDLAMPGMGGFEAIRALKENPAAPPVVAVSLYDSQVVRSEASMAGADAFVPKARLSTQLLAALHAVRAGDRDGDGAGRRTREAARERKQPPHAQQDVSSPAPEPEPGSELVRSLREERDPCS